MSTHDEARRLLHLPLSVRERIERGNKLVSEYYGEDGKLKSPEQVEADRISTLKAAEGGTTEGAVGNDNADSPPKTDEPKSDEQEPAGDRQGTTETPEGEVTTTAAAGADEPWEQRYRSLQGRFNQLATEQQRRDDEMRQLQEQVKGLTTARPRSDQPDVADADYAPLTNEERQSVGDDELLDYAARHAYQRISPKLAALEAKIAALEGGLQPIAQRVQRVQHDSLFSSLDRALPEWRKQNEDPKFLDWLEGVDPFSRIQRKLVLKQGIDDNDTARVVTVFNTFRAETGAKVQTRPAETMPKTTADTSSNGTGRVNGTGSSRVPLDSLVQPGRVRSAGSSTQTSTDEPPTVTRAELMQFRNDRARGVYRDDPKGLEEWSAYFDKAIAAGRVM